MKDKDLIKISFTGDILCKKQMTEAAKTGSGYDFRPVFERVKPLLERSDLVIGNLETPVVENREELVRKRISFGAPREFAEAVYDAGIHCVSTANNHALDRGIEGLVSTIRILDETGIRHTGTFERPEHDVLITDIRGVRIGILAYTYGTNAYHNRFYLDESEEWRINLFQKQELHNKFLRYIFVNRDDNFALKMLDRLYCLFHPSYIGKSVGERRQPDSFEIAGLKRDIERIRNEKPDLTVMCMHIGGQYNTGPSGYTRKTARFLKESGIDYVIGNHEHRIHGTDLSDIPDNKFTAYCLGNFISSSGVLEEPYDKEAEYSVLLHIYVNQNNKKTDSITFNILKIIETDKGGVAVVPAFEEYLAERDPGKKGEKAKALLRAAKRFSGREYGVPEEEFILYG